MHVLICNTVRISCINDGIVIVAGNMTRTLQEVQNEKSDQQMEVWVCSCTALLYHYMYTTVACFVATTPGQLCQQCYRFIKETQSFTVTCYFVINLLYLLRTVASFSLNADFPDLCQLDVFPQCLCLACRFNAYFFLIIYSIPSVTLQCSEYVLNIQPLFT